MLADTAMQNHLRRARTRGCPRGNRFLLILLIATTLAAASGCQEVSSYDGEPDALSMPAQALFELPRPGKPPSAGFFALPFPNDVRIDDESGRIDLGDLPRPNELLDLYFDAIEDRARGFSVVAASFVRFDAPIDIDSLPGNATESLAGDASVYMVNVDRASPRFGERVPLLFRFEGYKGEIIGSNWLSVLPYSGFVLAEETTYALLVTRRLRATNGSPVSASADFLAVMAGARDPDPAVARAQRIYAPLAAWLDQPGGDERADVVSASVFTTQDATSLMGKIRRVIWEQLPAPTARKLLRLGDGRNHYWFDGRYDAPNFQRGTPPFLTMAQGGDIEIDAGTGLPIIQRMEEMRLSFTIPKGTMPASGWPVVLFAHGTGGSFHSFRNGGVAERLAEQGLAVISIDQVMHPPRVPQGSSPELLFFNFQNPLAARDNTLQGAADNFQLLRLVQGFEHSERRRGGLKNIRFDGSRIYFFGHSQGGLTGPPFLAHEPLVHGAVLSGAGGLLYLSMILKTEPVNVAGVVGTVIRDYPLDKFNPSLALLQLYIDRADPVSYGPMLVRAPLPGIMPKHIFQSEGFTDRYTPVPSIEALATSIGVDVVEPVIAPIEGLSLAGRETLHAPVTGNQDGVTSVLLQYAESPGSDGHFVVFNVAAAQQQSSRFLGTLAGAGVATVVAPQ